MRRRTLNATRSSIVEMIPGTKAYDLRVDSAFCSNYTIHHWSRDLDSPQHSYCFPVRRMESGNQSAEQPYLQSWSFFGYRKPSPAANMSW